MAKPAPWTVTRMPLPRGDAGTFLTLKHMARFANESLLEPAVRNLAIRLVSGSRDMLTQIGAIRDWLQTYNRFVRDPSNIELVHRPERLLDEVQAWGYFYGDCDDVATIGAALGKAVGFPARFVVLGFLPPPVSPYMHVYAELQGPGADGPAWYDLDVTRPAVRPTVTRSDTYRV